MKELYGNITTALSLLPEIVKVNLRTPTRDGNLTSKGFRLDLTIHHKDADTICKTGMVHGQIEFQCEDDRMIGVQIEMLKCAKGVFSLLKNNSNFKDVTIDIGVDSVVIFANIIKI